MRDLNFEECKELMGMTIDQAVTDYVLFFYPKTQKQRKALSSAEGFLFDDTYRLNWGGKEYSLEDMLLVVNDEDKRKPIDVGSLRKAVKTKAYSYNIEQDKIKKSAQITLDFMGVVRDNEE